MRVIDKEMYWVKIQMSLDEDLNRKERDALGEILSSEILTKALGIVFQEAREVSGLMLQLKCSTPEGQHDHSFLRGKATGMTRVIEGLMDLCVQAEEDEPETIEESI